MAEPTIDAANLALARPRQPCGTGVVVLAGSSGAIEAERASLLAERGALALALRWFGGPGQQSGPWEVPLETFVAALNWLAPEVDRLALVGASFGAEAALSVGVVDDRVQAVVAIAPTRYVWPGADPTGRMTSHWTWRGAPLDFVPLDPTWRPPSDPPAFRPWYEQSLRTSAHLLGAAAIPAERLAGEVVLIAGEDDQVWPSADWARLIEARRRAAGRPTTVIVHPEAGHRVVFPGEVPIQRGQAMLRGGHDRADAELGAAAWPHVVRALHLRN